MAKSIDVCKAVATYLNNQPMGVTFQASYTNLEHVRREEMTGPQAFISPVEISRKASTRGEWSNTYTVVLTLACVMRTTNLQQQEEELVTLSEDIPRVLSGVEMAGCTMREFNDDGPSAIFEQTEYRQMDFFLAQVRLTYSDIS